MPPSTVQLTYCGMSERLDSITPFGRDSVPGDDSISSAGLAVTLLDFGTRAPIGAFFSPRLLELARRGSRSRWVITAQSLGAVCSWM